MSSDAITWIGTILTAIGTAVTLWQAGKVKRYKDQVAFDLRKISISEAGEILRRGQEDCRKLLKSGGRGQSITNICDSVQERLDQAMNRFNQKSQDMDIKEKLSSANGLLHEVRQGQNTNQNSSNLHVVFQETIQLCNELFWLNAPDTLIRDNTRQLLECHHGTKTQLQAVPKRI